MKFHVCYLICVLEARLSSVLPYGISFFPLASDTAQDLSALPSWSAYISLGLSRNHSWYYPPHPNT